MFHPFRQRLLPLALLALAASLIAGFVFLPRAAAAMGPDPVTAAWQRAQAAGSYAFDSDIVQVTLPAARITNVGRSSRTTQLYLRGQTNLHTNSLEMQLWSDGGSVLQEESAAAIRLENGKSFVRKGTGEWQESEDLTGSIAPHGDVMAYLRAVRDVQAHPPETRAGISFTRYSFQIDSPRFAAHMHKELEATLRARGELPPGLRLDVPAYYRDMIGSGELWVGEDGLPLRQILHLQFPEQHDEQVQAQMTVDFSRFGKPQTPPVDLLQSGDLTTFWHGLSTTLPDLTPLWLLTGLTVCAALAFRYRRVRLVEAALVTAVIFSQVVGPVLTTYTNVQFFDAQTAKAAAQDAEQAAAQEEQDLRAALGTVEFDPHLNPLAATVSDQSAAGSEPSLVADVAVAQAPALQTTDNGTDTDADSLSDFVEERVGTSELTEDTDADGLRDHQEVRGFSFDGKEWYLNPLVLDSNRDGQGDGLEWGLNPDGSLRTTPQDTDNDKLPDLFDADNDNDSVPDNKDLAPFVGGAGALNEATPLQLKLNNLTANKPAVVEFQLRPQETKHLWFAFNVLDWPQDSAGQMRDIDGITYADYASSGGRAANASEANGDLKLVPMLEIRIPADSANLPAQVDLTPFNITLNDFTQDGQTKVAYVPLNVVTDERTGQRVAFSGQMRYQPSGSWPNAHQVRLAWVVQALVDLPCDPENADEVAQGCQPDGYIHNTPQPIHTYYDTWSLTGLTVREDHGAKMALVYEDPAADSNKTDDAALATLSFVLDHHFVIGRDENNDGRRDLTVDEIANRFDRTRNSGYSEEQRFAVPNILRVVKHDYATIEQAVAFTTMTETQKILDTFTPLATADRTVKPLIFFAQESNARMLTLDMARTGGTSVVQNGAALTLDMAPSGQPAQPVNVTAGMKWAAYCGSAAAPLTWEVCTPDEYWAELERRYAALPSLPEDANPEWVGGRLQLAQLYYTGLSNGYYAIVQEGTTVPSIEYSLEGEDTTTANVRASLRGLATLPVMVGLAFERSLRMYLTINSGMRGRLVEFGATLRQSLRNAENALKTYKPGTLAYKTAMQTVRRTQFNILRFYTSPVAAAGAIFTTITQIVSLSPDVPLTTRTVIGTLSLVSNLVLNVTLTAVEVGFFIRSGGTTLAKILNATAQVSKGVKIGGAVGLALTAITTWSFFIYAAVESGAAVGSPELNKAFFEAVAATLLAVFLFVISLTIVGLLVVIIVALIDSLLTLICELGVDELRNAPGLGGACFTLSTAAVKGIAYFLYNFDVMINTDRQDLMVTGAPDITLLDPNQGYRAGNQLTVALPVTTTVVHKDPDPANGIYINFYLYLFSPDNLRSSTFKYSLTQPNPQTLTVARDQMKGEWQGVREDHKYVLTPMYRGQAVNRLSLPPVTLTAGINRPAEFYFNLGYAVPAYECIGIPNIIIPFIPPIIPVCYTREVTGSDSPRFDDLKFDVFPATIAEFMSLSDKGSGAVGLGWDAAFPALADADGDGLLTGARNGLDPNDTLADSDGDGLSDPQELGLRANGIVLSPILRDTDADGLTDAQEVQFGTDPAVADSDNDGLLDGIEVWHQRYDPNNGEPTPIWEGGWDVRINATTPFTVRVSSDPSEADSDGDGLSDQAERELALATCTAQEVAAGRRCEGNPLKPVDRQNRPFHPAVYNTPPINVITASDDFDGFVRPGQSFRYTTTVIANEPVVPGVLNVTAPASVGGSPNPLALNFSASPTVTQPSNFTVAGNATTGDVALTSTANTRLPGSNTAGWAWQPVTEEQLPPVTTPNLINWTALAASRADRGDGYSFAAQSVIPGSAPNDGFGQQRGDLLAYTVPSGVTRQLDMDTDEFDTDYRPAELNGAFLRGTTAPSVACNDAGNCLVAWEHLDYCNSFTINSLTVVAEGTDGIAGVEPLIYLVSDPSDSQPRDGGFHGLWGPNGNGGNDIRTGQTRGPDANGFPIHVSFCGPTRLYVSELDGSSEFVPDPTQTQWDAMAFLGSHLFSPTADRGATKTLDFTGGEGYHIRLNVSVQSPPSGRQRVIAAAMLAPDGTISKPQFQLSPTDVGQQSHYNPTVTSDGANFLVAWENVYSVAPDPVKHTSINTRAVDSNGNASDPVHETDGVRLNGSSQDQAYAQLAAVWASDRYIVTRLIRQEAGVTTDAPETISARNFAANGSPIAGTPVNLVNDAEDGASSNHDLAWDPVRRNALLVYRSNGFTLKGRLFGSQTVGPVQLADVGLMAQAAYHPASQSWLVSHEGLSRVEFLNLTWNLGGSLVTGAPPQFPSQLATNNLACPMPGSVPVVDLRLEDAPGTTSFVDSAGYGNSGACSGASCPAAGVLGAPNAPLSDYGVRFDGTDDFITVNRALPENFSVAYWVKSAPDANPNTIVIDQGANEAGGWTLWLGAGQPSFLIGNGQSLRGAARIDDGQWHFVVGTRHSSSGAAALYVDGVLVASGTFATGALSAANNLRIGGDRTGARDFRGELDHVQAFPVALAADAVQALYNRTQQNYCVGSGVDALKTQIRWARLQLTQQDTRGGRISASGGLKLTVDAGLPTSTLAGLTANEFIQGGQPTPRTTIIGGSATDATSGVALVEVSINNGPWQPAEGAATWTFPLSVGEGNVNIRTRATDATGNVETPGAGITVRGDATVPAVTLAALPATPVKPTRNANGQWTVAFNGMATDGGSGMSSVEVHLQGDIGEVQDHGWQAATRSGNGWSVNYALDTLLADPTGLYTVTVRATDNVGNRTADNAASGILRLDGTAPVATLSQADALRQIITGTVTLTGLVTDTNSTVGLSELEIAFTPIEQIAALPASLTSDEAEAQLNRTWTPVTLAQSGAGKASSAWSVAVPAGLEGEYQIDLRGTDLLQNQQITANLWRGVIDNRAPRVAMTGTATGATYVDPATNTQRYEIRYICAATDRNLNEAAFVCPGEGLQPPVRSFENNPALQALFPDRTIRSGLAISYTLWESSQQPAATASACDAFGACASASTPAASSAVAAAAETVQAAAAPGAPTAVIIAPTAGSFVVANNTVSVTVAAEAGALLKEVTIKLDNTVVQTLSFTQAEAVNRTLRTVGVTVASEGSHTLVAQATDWAGATQSTLFPITFMMDKAAPTLTIDASALTIADTWQAESGILRFNGNASDSVGLAAVQIREGVNPFTDAIFGGGTWRTALPVEDPEGRTLNITVRAIDRAGRITTLTQAIATNLSAADAPDTTISSGPANPSATNSATFVFVGTLTAVAFDCQVDNGSYTPCTSPWTVNDLSKGSHTFRVRAIDTRGFADLTPASVTWTVSASQPDATITDKPANPTTERTASFSFTGTGTSFECSLDGSAFTACTNPKSYSGLSNGEHTFLVRARDAAGKAGAADRYIWTVINAPPTVAGQLLMTGENGALAITLQGTDSDALTYQIVEQPQNGFLIGQGQTLTYVPNTGFAGPDRFTYRAWDGEAYSAPATVYITVRLGKYALFASEGLALEQNSSVVRGDVGVNTKSNGPFLRSNVEASFGQDVKLQSPTSRVLADSIVVDNNATVYNPSYNDLTGRGQVLGTRTTPLALPLRSGLPGLPTITPGTQNVDVAQNSSRTLAAGSYGALNAAQNTTIIFSGGIYHFATWTVAQNSKLHFQAPSEVRIAGRLVVGQNGFVGPAPGATAVDAGQIVIYVAGQNGTTGALDASPKTAFFEQGVNVSAYVVVPNGTLHFRQNGQLTGVFIGKWLLGEQNVKVTRLADPAAAASSAIDEAPPVVDTPVIRPAEQLDNALYLPLVTADAASVSADVTVAPAPVEVTPVSEMPVVTETPLLTATLSLTATQAVTATSDLVEPTTTPAPVEAAAALTTSFLPLVGGDGAASQ
jgi:hypothetical protein